MNNFCQSCGYPMKKDKKGGGSNADGSTNEKYCSMCYENGKFLSPPDVDTAHNSKVLYSRNEKRWDEWNFGMDINAWDTKLERWRNT